MAEMVTTPTKTFTAGAAIAKWARVKLSAGKLAAAGAAEQALGVIENQTFADGDIVAVRLKTAQGTLKMIAGGSISVGDAVYGAASGKVSATANGNPEGVALTAGEDGTIIEVLHVPTLDTALNVQGLAADYKIASGQHTTVAAADTVATGLTTVVSVVVQLDSDPADGAMHATGTIGDQAGSPAAGSIIIKTWKSTDGDATLVAADAFSKKVNWIAIGT